MPHPLQKKNFPGPIPLVVNNAQRQERSFPGPIPVLADKPDSLGKTSPEFFDFGSPMLLDTLQTASALHSVHAESPGVYLVLRQHPVIAGL